MSNAHHQTAEPDDLGRGQADSEKAPPCEHQWVFVRTMVHRCRQCQKLGVYDLLRNGTVKLTIQEFP